MVAVHSPVAVGCYKDGLFSKLTWDGRRFKGYRPAKILLEISKEVDPVGLSATENHVLYIYMHYSA